MIEIITEPQVYLIGKLQINNNELNRFLEANDIFEYNLTGNCDAEDLAEIAGRIDYNSFINPKPGGNKEYLKRTIEQKHGNLLEASVWNFIITDISRSLSLELIRHRTLSPSQESQRYVNCENHRYIIPDEIYEDEELFKLWSDTINHCRESYIKLAEKIYERKRIELLKESDIITQEKKTHIRKESLQAARSVLPNAIETKIFITANARALRNFIEQRGSKYADSEIRKLAFKFLDIMQKESPNLFGDYEIINREIVTQHRKV